MTLFLGIYIDICIFMLWRMYPEEIIIIIFHREFKVKKNHLLIN